MRLRVCRVEEVPPGQMASFAVDGLAIPVLVVHQDGRFWATSGMCPHEDVELVGGDLDGTQVSCPGHGYEFDVQTGACSHDRTLCLRRFTVVVVDDELHIEVDLLSPAS